MNNNEILQSREERINNIKALMRDGFNYLIVKANYPGSNKNEKGAKFLVHIFKNIIINKIKVERFFYFDSFDGPYYILETKMDKTSLKREMILIEESHSLGRFIDLDVFSLEGSVNRKSLGYRERKCFICDNDAHVCSRNKTHSINELKDIINDSIESYLKNTLKEIIEESMLIELELDPKFGLVSRATCGSHSDMDFSLMERTIPVISPFLVQMALVGYTNNLNDAFYKIREIGKEAEKAMLKETNNVNTYKGLIFVLGFALCALGNYIIDYEGTLQNRIVSLSKPLKCDFEKMTGETFGERAYLESKISGARGEVINGMPTVFDNLSELIIEKNSLLNALTKIINKLDDTVLLKRSGSLEKYHYYKELVGNSKVSDYQEVTKKCIEEGISFGGSADMLVVLIVLKKIKEMFDYE